MIETEDLRKSYEAVEALRGLDLRVPAGSICGFLGRNGAGKTTAMKILLGLTHPTSGRARLFDLDAGVAAESIEIRRRCAFVSEDKDLYTYMTVGEMIGFTASFFPQWRADLQDRYARRFALPLNSRVKTLSRGGRTKLALLLALCRGAELLILDEPTSGLDPAMVEEVLQLLVASEGTTIFFSSHQIAEVEQVADRVVMIDGGRAVVSGDLDELRARYGRVRAVFAGDAPQAPLPARVKRDGRVLTAIGDAGAITSELRALQPVSIEVMPVALKDIFLECAHAEE